MPRIYNGLADLNFYPMPSNLQKLYITPGDLQAIAGVSQRDLKAYEQLKYLRLALLITLGGYIERILLFRLGIDSPGIFN